MNRWWVLQLPDGVPRGVIAVIEGDGLPRRYVPGEGLVDWPALTMFTHNGEAGAYRITEEEALALIRDGGGGPMEAWVVAQQRGKAPTLQPPGL